MEWIPSIHARRRIISFENAFGRKGAERQNREDHRVSSTLVTLRFPMGKEMKWQSQLQLTVTQLLCLCYLQSTRAFINWFSRFGGLQGRSRKTQRSAPRLALLQSIMGSHHHEDVVFFLVLPSKTAHGTQKEAGLSALLH